MQRTTKAISFATLFAGFVLGLAACPGARTGGNRLLHGVQNPSPEVVEGCDLAKKKCTRCHTMDQLIATTVDSPEAWRHYVHRMRLMPGAGIQMSDEPKITQCLVYRSFGQEGLTALKDKPQ